MTSVGVGVGSPTSAARETGAERPPRALTESGALTAPTAAASAGATTTTAGGSVPGSANALNNLRQGIAENTCPTSGLTTDELEDHIDGVTRMVVQAKGWDRIQAEYCVRCGRLTRAVSQVCTDHELEHV